MIYEKIKEYCARNQIAISNFEKMCGLGNGTVAGWKDDRNKPSLNSLQKIEKGTQIALARWIN